MPSRTKEQLEVIFADNNRGLITAQDIRDLIESTFQFGGLSLSPGQTPNPQTISQDFVCLNQWQAVSPNSSDIILNSSAGTIEIDRAGVYGINVSLSFSGSNNSKWTGSLFRNNEDFGLCTFIELLRPAGDVSCVGGFDPGVIREGDVLEYRIKANGNNKQFVLESGQFYIFRIG